jgi:hypothetical protein
MTDTRTSAKELSPEADAMLAQFSNAENFEIQIDALNSLNRSKQIIRAAGRPEFQRGLLKLFEKASDRHAGNERLLAVSWLGLVAATVNLKPFRQRLQDGLRGALTEPLPPMQNLRTADERLYVAQACAISAQPWCPKYLSDSAIAEETGENARAECLRGLADQVKDLQSVLDYLRASIEQLVPETESPANSAGRRLRRILSALRPAVQRCRVAPGTQPGRTLAEMLREPFKKFGRPDEVKVLEDLAGETFALIHELMRAGFSLATESSTYAALRVCQSWFPEHKWQNLTAESESLHLVVQDLREALILLAKQNVTDQALLEVLGVACGSRERARAITSEIGSSLPGLSTDVRRFLGAEDDELGDGISLDRKPGEINSTSEIMHLADLLVAAELLYGEAEAALQSSRAASESANILRILAQALALADSTRSLARRHFLELRGRAGEVVDYSQIDHEMAGGFKPGVRRVRIRRPTVVQLRGSLPHVVRKGLVEPADTFG